MISSHHKNHGNLARERIFAPLKCAHSLPPMICPLHSSALFRHAEKVRTGCRGETVHTQTFCRQFLIRNSVIFDVENFSPNRPSSSGACESPFKAGISVGVPECRVSGWCRCHLSSLAAPVKIRFGVFSSRWHCKVLSRIDCQLFVGHGRNEEFFHANGMAMPFVGAEEGDDGCFFGMPHWQFNDWTVADGMELQFCTCTLSQQTSTLTT